MKQKEAYDKGKLDQLKIDLLNDLDFDWELDPEPTWDDYYAELCEYHAQYNTTLLNQRINRNLAKWCNEQRSLYKKKLLLMKQVAKLNLLDFDWHLDKYADTDWMAMYYRLLAYKNKHGNVLVPQNYIEDPPLGIWVTRQRKIYLKFFEGHDSIDASLLADTAAELATTRIPAEVHEARLKSLVDVGFVWHVLEAQWLEMYQRLLEYKKQKNSTLVPRKYEKDQELGTWVQEQRKCKLEGIMFEKRIHLLDDAGFVWDPWGDKWNEMFERLCRYKADHGNTRVPKKYVADLELGTWVDSQKTFFKEKRLAPERINKLESIGFEWSIRTITITE